MQVLDCPQEVRLALIYLRVLHGWNQAEMAERAGLNKSLISLYEQGKQVPSGKSFSRLLSAFNLPVSMFETILSMVRLLCEHVKGSEEETVELVAAVARGLATSIQVAVSLNLAGLLTAIPQELPEELSSEPETLGEWFTGSGPAMQKTLARDLREFHTWGFCEWLCQEMERTVETDAAEALRLAELALDVASRVPEGDTPRQRLQGYVWAHLAHARRAAGDLPGAEEASKRARELWEACDPDDSDVGLAERFMALLTE
jgi:transcriptional regulator with XRE-family HTH domain